MKNLAQSLLAMLAATLTPAVALAQASNDYSGYPGFGPHMMWGGGWVGWIVGPLMMIVFVGIVVAVVLALMRGFGGGWAHGVTRSDPLDILKERYAKGEIDQAEYEERRRVLTD
ncbi:MAG: SHOCT domain-containing protein [Inquilinus sp.]|nr:SHOCT domain-containing protein [Inquilinus sp.]